MQVSWTNNFPCIIYKRYFVGPQYELVCLLTSIREKCVHDFSMLAHFPSLKTFELKWQWSYRSPQEYLISCLGNADIIWFHIFLGIISVRIMSSISTLNKFVEFNNLIAFSILTSQTIHLSRHTSNTLCSRRILN
jgi:hypothetical protein